MINNKAQLKKALAEKKPLLFKTIRNDEKPERVGTIRKPGTKQQTNAFTIATKKENGATVDSWSYYNEIEISNNIIKYKHFNIEIEIIEEAQR